MAPRLASLSAARLPPSNSPPRPATRMPSALLAQTPVANGLSPSQPQAQAIRRSSHCEPPPLLAACINLSHALRNHNLNRNLTPSSSPANVIWTAAAKRSVDAALAAFEASRLWLTYFKERIAVARRNFFLQVGATWCKAA